METKTDIRPDIRKADDDFEAAFSRGDASGLSSLYTQDGMLLPTGSDFVQGRKAIGEFWQGAMDMGIKAAKLEIVEAERHGDVAIEVGRYQLRGADGGQLDSGKYIVIWRQEAGTWKLHRDIWNSSMPAQ